MSDEKIFAAGLIVKRNENAPEYVMCNLSVKVDEFAAFAQQYQSNGWLNIQCKVSKNGKMYAELDTWKPTQGDAAKGGIVEANRALRGPDSAAAPDDFNDSIPF
jgi:hypothetical protein